MCYKTRATWYKCSQCRKSQPGGDSGTTITDGCPRADAVKARNSLKKYKHQHKPVACSGADLTPAPGPPHIIYCLCGDCHEANEANKTKPVPGAKAKADPKMPGGRKIF